MTDFDLTHINKINEWLRDGDVGTSSAAIVTKLTGLNICKSDDMFAPSDPSDLLRCIRLLEYVPELKPRIVEMSGVSDRWKVIVDNWDELENLLVDELPTGKAPKTYMRMTELFEVKEARASKNTRLQVGGSDGS